MPQSTTSKNTPLDLKERHDGRSQPWKSFMSVTHTKDSPVVLGDRIRLLGQRVNAHVG